MKSLFFLSAIALISAAPANAQEIDSSPRTYVSVVHTADLDLSRGGDQRRLEERLARAAREVCGEASNADLAGKNDIRKCRDEAVSRAVAQSEQMLAAKGKIIAVTATR